MTHRTVHLFDRREVLRLGGVATLAGCDQLVLPDVQLDAALDPVTPTELFYVQSAFGTPDVDPDAHTLEVWDRGALLGAIDLAAVRSLTARTLEHSLQCIGARPEYLFIGNAIWGGLPFVELLDALGIPRPAPADSITFLGADGYHTSVPYTDLLGASDLGTDLPLWLVWEMNGDPLTAAHGAPFRFLTPGRYGTKNPKWPVRIDFIDGSHVGYWEERGWSDDATYRLNGLVLSPPDGLVVDEGTVRLLGSAFAGPRDVASVEVSADDGATWEPAAIDYTRGDVWEGAPVPYNPGAQVWTLWHFDFQPPTPGRYAFVVRVRGADGAVTVDGFTGSGDRGGYPGGMRIELEVR